MSHWPHWRWTPQEEECYLYRLERHLKRLCALQQTYTRAMESAIKFPSPEARLRARMIGIKARSAYRLVQSYRWYQDAFDARDDSKQKQPARGRCFSQVANDNFSFRRPEEKCPECGSLRPERRGPHGELLSGQRQIEKGLYGPAIRPWHCKAAPPIEKQVPLLVAYMA
jgi:hypothetical protein